MCTVAGLSKLPIHYTRPITTNFWPMMSNNNNSKISRMVSLELFLGNFISLCFQGVIKKLGRKSGDTIEILNLRVPDIKEHLIFFKLKNKY